MGSVDFAVRSMPPWTPPADPSGSLPARQSTGGEESPWEGGSAAAGSRGAPPSVHRSFATLKGAGAAQIPPSIQARISAIAVQHAASQARTHATSLREAAADAASHSPGAGPLSQPRSHDAGRLAAELAARDLSSDLSAVFDGHAAVTAKSADPRSSEHAVAEAEGGGEEMAGALEQSRRTAEILRARVAQLEGAAEAVERARRQEADELVALRMQVERLQVETEVQALHIASLRAAETKGASAPGRSAHGGAPSMVNTSLITGGASRVTESVRYVRPGVRAGDSLFRLAGRGAGDGTRLFQSLPTGGASRVTEW